MQIYWFSFSGNIAIYEIGGHLRIDFTCTCCFPTDLLFGTLKDLIYPNCFGIDGIELARTLALIAEHILTNVCVYVRVFTLRVRTALLC